MFQISRSAALRLACTGALGLAFGLSAAEPASALTILAKFDPTVSSQAQAAFNRAADVYEASFSNPATVNINVSWGSVAGHAMPSGALGASSSNLYGYFTYSQIHTDLINGAKGASKNAALTTALASLTTAGPAGPTRWVMPSAEAKALGMISGTSTSIDGYIGFANNTYDFDPVNGVTAGYYDFEGIAAHEIAEVLGRISGISTSTAFRTPFDLYRYTAPGVASYGYSDAAYFSINGGVTNLKRFNNGASGDRGDWLSTTGLYDVSNAFLTKGVPYYVSNADLTALDALGWGGVNAGNTAIGNPTGRAFNLVIGPDAVPEPATWAVMLMGFFGMGAMARRRRGALVAAPVAASPEKRPVRQ